MRPGSLHSRSAEENCSTENVASLRSVKVATPPCAAKYLSDTDPTNAFNPQAYLNRALHPEGEDTFDAYEIEDDEPEEDVPIDLDVMMYYTLSLLKYR